MGKKKSVIVWFFNFRHGRMHESPVRKWRYLCVEGRKHFLLQVSAVTQLGSKMRRCRITLSI